MSLGRNSLIELNVTDDAGLLFVLIAIEPSGGHREIVYDGAFRNGYTGPSNVAEAIDDGFHFEILRDALWPLAGITLYITAIDTGGNIEELSQAYSIHADAEEDEEEAAEVADNGEGGAVDLMLDEDGDLAIVAGDLVLTRGVTATRQSAIIRVRFFRGEWFLDPEEGVPYRTEFFVKNPNLPACRQHYRTALLGAAGAAEVTALELELDSATRTSFAEFTLTREDGEDVTAEVEI